MIVHSVFGHENDYSNNFLLHFLVTLWNNLWNNLASNRVLTGKGSNKGFRKFWETFSILIVEIDVHDPILRRQRKLSERFDEGCIV